MNYFNIIKYTVYYIILIIIFKDNIIKIKSTLRIVRKVNYIYFII